MTRPARFEGSTAIVTGAASGIGRALSDELTRHGATVIRADISEGDGIHTLDVRDRDGFEALASAVIAEHGRLDFLFNNAGVSMGGPTHELTGEHWDRIIDINLRGVVNGLLAVYPRMVRQGHGHIVNTASGAGLAAPPFVTPYAATKSAVIGLSTGLRAEAASHGVRVSVLCPGAVETPILDRLPDADLPPRATQPVTARAYLAKVRQKPVPADEFARASLAQVARNRNIIVVPRSARLLWYLNRLSPAVTDRIGRSLVKIVERDLIRPRAD